MHVSDRGDLGLAKREPRLEWSWWTESFDSWEDRQGQNRRPRLRWLYKHTRAILVQHDTDTRTRTHTQAQMAGSHRHKRRVNTHTASAAAMVLHHHSLYPTKWPAQQGASSLEEHPLIQVPSVCKLSVRPEEGARLRERFSDPRMLVRRFGEAASVAGCHMAPQCRCTIATGMRAAVGSEKL